MNSRDYEVPDYTVVVIYDNDNSKNLRMIEDQQVSVINFIIHQFSQISNEQINGVPLHISQFTNRGDKSNKYTACIPKKLNDYFSTEDGKTYLRSMNLNVVRYSTKRKGRQQKIYGLFVPGPTEIITSIFSNLEKGFIRPGSYKIIRPPTDENGTIRDYSIVTFDVNQKGVIPSQFVEKIKVLLEDTDVGNNRSLRVKWLNKRVFDDINNGVNKKINTENSASMET